MSQDAPGQDTISVADEASDHALLERVPTLTIVFHPDPERIGDVARLGRATRLARHETAFVSPSGASRPLDDPVLSRRPLVIEQLSAGAGGTFAIRPAVGGSEVVLDGQPLLDAMAVTAADLARGVMLELKRRVVLLFHLARREREPGPSLGIIGDSDSIARVRQSILRVARFSVPVLIRGESGSGKELVARAIHDNSPRAAGPLVSVNMGTVSASTAVSELFGHERGAFTGADARHEGVFTQAHGGTLFLDEIGVTASDVQAMLLRVLETGRVRPLGGKRSHPVDVRLITATDADLDRDVHDERFRLALLHRLAGFEVRLPPLRARRDDIGRLFIHFLRHELRKTGEHARLEPPAPGRPSWLPAWLFARLLWHDWPGNVRELENVARQVAIENHQQPTFRLPAALEPLLGARAEREHAAPRTAGTGRRGVKLTLDEERVIAVLRAHGWRPGPAAAELGISRTSLYKWMDESPRIRQARDIPRAEIESLARDCGGDVDAMARALEVSKRSLQLRMSELGLDY